MRFASRPIRALPAAAAAAVVALLLTGCTGPSAKPASSSPAASASPSASAATSATTCAKSGTASDSVKVTGTGRAAPTVKFPLPISTTATERTVLTAGQGAAVRSGSSVQIAYTLVEGRTGKKLDQSGYAGKKPVTLTADTAQYLPGLVQALQCGREGERFASVIPASAAFGAAGSKNLGVGPNDSLVLVADILALTPTKATGSPKALPAGFPAVRVASSGQPTVSIPAGAAPKTLRIADRLVGSGDTVKNGDTVTVQYQGVVWRTGAVFDQSWGKTGPASFATGAVVKGFRAALIGQKVGSQVVALVPPADGYGKAGTGNGAIKGTDVMVFVIDILATTHA
jgi:peptidylprolyl isomerase